ncbi:MAG: GGDEF domain-containing protein [Planctomycetes bacterium]|nr:GGDEF domain-containing protein [Planctomycetota bacterium]
MTSSFQDSEPNLFSLSQIMHLMRVEFSRAQRYRYPVACLIVSVDRLNQLRDLYGYDAKEAILSEVIELLRTTTRSCDFLGRLSDDRFLAVVPHTPAEGARVLAERLLAATRQLEFQAEGRELKVTCSIGSSHNEGGATLFFDAMLSAAEGALAEAQSGGGDRYVARDPGTGAS